MSEGATATERVAGSATLVLVRHGESRWNAAGVLQGQRCAGLSARGESQAESVAEYLVKAHSDASLLVRSDIDRVAQTAAPIENRLGVEVTVEPRLREIDLGVWSGRPRDEVLATQRADLEAWLRCEDVRPEGGETLSELRTRVWQALSALGSRLLAEGGGTAVCVTHGGPVRTAVAAVLGLPPGEERRLQAVRNASTTLIRLDPDGLWRVVAYNRVDHLR